MLPSSPFYLIVVLLVASTLGDRLKNISKDNNDPNFVRPRLQGQLESYQDKLTKESTNVESRSNSSEESVPPRDKRALGVFLQGLAEVLGYTASPVSLASLPNPNTTVAGAAAAPPTIYTFPGIATPPPAPPAPPAAPQRPMPPAPPPVLQKPNPPVSRPQLRGGTAPSALPPMTPMTPRQRETLRFTGVVNFGNNSDILGHLAQYQTLFHGGASTTAAPPSTTPAPAQLGLIPPFFVQIPLPIAPNVPVPLPPSAPRKVPQMAYRYTTEANKGSYNSESGEISNEDTRGRPSQGQRDTYIDEPEWKKKEREEQRNKYREESYSEESSEKQRGEKEDDEEEDSKEDDKKNNYQEAEEDDSRESYERKKPYQAEYSKRPEKDDDSKSHEGDDESNEKEEYKERSKESTSRTNDLKDEDYTTLRNDYRDYSEPFDFSPEKIPPLQMPFGMRLPIRVFDSPFSHQGEFRNSYGQRLENGGHIDESVADYFERYKHPETGLFDLRKIESLDGLKKGDNWWEGHQGLGELHDDGVARIRNEYGPRANARYEEYNLEERSKESPKKVKKEDAEEDEEDDEEVEPTNTTYMAVKAPEARRKHSDEHKENGGAEDAEEKPREVSRSSKTFEGREENLQRTSEHSKSDEDEEERSSESSKVSRISDEEDSLEKTKIHDNAERLALINPLPFKGFDFIKYSPYFRPLQISYEPKKLQRTADRILSYRDFGHFRQNGDVEKLPIKKENYAEEDEDRFSGDIGREKNAIGPSTRLTGSRVNDNDLAKFNPYVKPIRYVYEPESLEKTVGRISSYRNLGPSTKNRDSAENYRETSEEIEEPEVDRSSENLKEDEDANDDESEAERSSEDLRENYDRPEVNVSSENYRENYGRPEVERSSSENLKGEEDSSYDEPEERRSSEYDRKDYKKPEVARNSQESRKNYEQPEVDRFSQNSRNSYEQPGVENFLQKSKKNYGKPEVYRHTQNSRNNYKKPEVDRSTEHSRRIDEKAEVSPYAQKSRRRYKKPEVERSVEYSGEKFNERPEVGLPEKLTGRRLHEGESKEIRAWPSPFDHTFDSTESTKTISPLKIENPTKFRYSDDLEPTRETPIIRKKYSSRTSGNRNRQNISPTYETPSIDELRNSRPTGSRYRDSDPSPTYESSIHQKLPNSKISENDSKNDRNRYQENPEIPTFQPEVWVPERARGFSFRDRYREDSKPEVTQKTQEVDEKGEEPTRRSLPVRPKTFDDPASAHDFFNLSKDDYNLEGDRKVTENIRDKSTTPSLTDKKHEYIGELIVKTEDPDYQRPANLTEFTAEPETETEKVRVKEYRNKIATIKITERKQLSPNGPVELVGFRKKL